MTRPDHLAALVEAEEFAGGPMIPAAGRGVTNIDLRDADEIRASLHAVAHLPRYDRVVRGIDRFTHLPTRERAAMVWLDGRNGADGLRCEAVALDDITICPGVQS